MARHVENARAVTEMLEANDAVAWVKYPTASDHPDRALAAELYPNGTGAILSFGVKGGRAAGKTFIESVKLASHLANVGDAKTSCCTRPAPPTSNSRRGSRGRRDR